MMELDQSKFNACDICGDHIGAGFDHAECSKLKQEFHRDDKRPKSPKKLSRAQTDRMGIQANKHYD